MRPIRLPEPPSGAVGMPEIFEGGVNVIRRAVVIGNGFAGAENQCFGLVRALGLADKQTIYRVTRPRGGINEYLHWLPVSLHKIVDILIRQIFGNSRFGTVLHGKKLVPFPIRNGGNVGLSSILEADAKKIAAIARETFDKEGPTLVVACGRDTISLASSVRRLALENVFVVQIQHPRSRLDRFDLVVTPRHDYYALTASGQQEIPRFFRRWVTPREPPGRNVVLTVGALHQADSAALRIAANAWHDELAPLPKPLLVINIGGPTRNCRYGADLAKQLVISLHNVLTTCGSVRISFSRRTPQKVSDIIVKELGSHPKIYIWDGRDPNPHMGHLAWADAFIITADSISMLSEACSTGKPVYVIGTEHCKWKFSAFHKTLRDRGVVRPFTGLEDISNSWSYPPLNDAAEAAIRVRELLAERGWSLGR
ncbi:mitochondrial fission protein ELM1 [Ananas comosus]|uniref:Mitochondrial fission protein ELM1 n=1 Tax=Ananas comosus TaxID=4615 RepID=A0A199UV44_ANACO|nr:mitochondrial fission protein ELM1 [Ananas comosus]OAY68672.1 Mitochondrial fission protein ELM1 [Ananas comosus]